MGHDPLLLLGGVRPYYSTSHAELSMSRIFFFSYLGPHVSQLRSRDKV